MDKKAIDLFPPQIKEASPVETRHIEIATGIEYAYVYCRRLFGHPGDIHAVRIDCEKAKIRPYISEGAPDGNRKAATCTTSDAAASQNALLAINGGMFRWKDLIPFYRMKIDGKILKSNAGGTIGLAFSNDGSKIKVGSVSDAELPSWDNFMAGETLVANGKCALDWPRKEGPKTKPEAPRTLLGMDAEEKYLWLVVTGGRRKGNNPSMGLSYMDAADLLMWMGCAYGINFDGGGSTTLAVRKDALKGAKKPYSPEARPAADKDYVILNCTSDGRERKVLDGVLFLDSKSKPSKK